MQKIPLVDLKKSHALIKQEVETAIQKVIDDGAFVSRKYVEPFENNFAQYCGAKYCIATGSGSDALITAYFSAGISKGDEVITVANTFTATAEPLWFLGAIPVFVDIDPKSQTIAASKIEEKITERTKAIAPVHIFGQPANMPEIVRIAKKHNLKIIEDCAHAHGAEVGGKKVGTFSDVAAYSFNPAKILGAYGDAGCVITDNDGIAERAREFSNHGRETKNKYVYDFFGLNLRMDGIQAAILDVKLKYLSQWVEKRRQIADWYSEMLPKNVVTMPKDVFGKTSYHLYVISTPKRDELLNYLKENGIEAGIHYPIPLHLQEAYSHIETNKKPLPVTEKAAKEILSLPMFPEMTQEEVSLITSTISDFFTKNA